MAVVFCIRSPRWKIYRKVSNNTNFSRLFTSRPAKVKWFYNTDQPISKPAWHEYTQEEKPENFLPFSDYDNARLESAYECNKRCVDVKEDQLFKVDMDKMQLSAIYWKGPVCEVRRGTWFTREGMPISKKLASRIEDGYNNVQAYKYQARNSSQVSRDLAAMFNKQIKEKPSDEAVDITKEKDVVDLGNGQAVIYFSDVHGALFPKELSALQVNIIRSLQPSYKSLMSVVPIQRGYTSDLDSSIIDSVTSTNVTSITEKIHTEVASMFSKTPATISEAKDKLEQRDILGKAIETELKNDQREPNSKRDVDHLILCVHGIGQLLGSKYETVDFPHSINVMRSVMKNVFANESKYQKLAYGSKADPENEQQKANNRIQILPVSWRHNVSFHPQKGGNTSPNGKQRIPTLNQVNVDGIRPLRSIVGDVVLDVLLYYEPRYLRQIMEAVSSELNFVYKEFLSRNPDFKGKVHLFGHSLGSAICFDLLSQQKTENEGYKLDFDVDNLFCVGSPVGMFEVLKRRNIKPRSKVNESDIDLDADFSSPKCKNLYNIFHPCDPVSYRMEPLVDTDFANLKAEEVPFALKGFNTQVQNLTSLGDEVQEKIHLASNWFRKTQGLEKKAPTIADENALGDILSSLTSPGSQKTVSHHTKTQVYDERALGDLLNLNRTGRIDYCLPTGVFSIAIVSAISAHISYFEDQETVGFVMKEVLSSSEPPVKSRKVTIYSQN